MYNFSVLFICFVVEMILSFTQSNGGNIDFYSALILVRSKFNFDCCLAAVDKHSIDVFLQKSVFDINLPTVDELRLQLQVHVSLSFIRSKIHSTTVIHRIKNLSLSLFVNNSIHQIELNKQITIRLRSVYIPVSHTTQKLLRALQL